MKLRLAAMCAAILIGSPLGLSTADAAAFSSYSPELTGGMLINFDDLPDGTIVSSQYAGVTFSQTPSGSPQIDTYPFLFAYGSSSGNGVLTGSTEGGNAYPTVAGIEANFATPQTSVQVFLSDTSTLGDYPITILGRGDSVLASFTVPGSDIVPPNYTGGLFPPPGTTPLPGIFVGYLGAAADVYGIQIGPSTAYGDAFAVDDLRYTGASVSAAPELPTWLLLFTGVGGIGLMLRRAQKATVVQFKDARSA